MMPKYVYYCNEIRNRGTDKECKREFFRIEKHPYLLKVGKKMIASSKSTKINILDKLDEIKIKLTKLDNGIIESNTNNHFPKYISIRQSKRNDKKQEIIFERRKYGKRQTLTKTIDLNDDPMDYIPDFVEEVKNKYDYDFE